MIGGLGLPELIVIFGIGLLVFGASRIPDIAKSVGKAINEFKKAGKEITDAGDLSTSEKKLATKPKLEIEEKST